MDGWMDAAKRPIFPSVVPIGSLNPRVRYQAKEEEEAGGREPARRRRRRRRRKRRRRREGKAD